MTEISRPWAGTTVGDAGPYTAAHWWDVWQAMIGSSGALRGTGNLGVFSGVPGQLAVTYVAPNTLQVAAGAAMVDGTFYCNDNTFSATVTSATAGNVRDDRLVLRKYFSGLIQSVRIVLLPGSEAGTPGPGTPPALTQDTTRQTYWDLPLARVSITELGVITVTDERVFLFVESAPVFVGAISGYNGTTPGMIVPMPTLAMPASATSTAWTLSLIMPHSVEAKAWPIVFNSAGPGNAYMTYSATGGAIGSSYVQHQVVSGYAAHAIPSGSLQTRLTPPLDLIAAGFLPRDIIHLAIGRDATNLLDTLNASQVAFVGFELEFTL